MKFRDTFVKKISESILIPIVSGYGFYYLSDKIMRIYMHRMIYYRMFKLGVSINLTLMLWSYINSQQWSCKPFHEIVTQPEPNGKYIRSILKDNYPRNWSMMSKHLHELGYNFKEMNEYSENEFMPDVTYKFDNSMY
jgi:hypothetical protein